MIHTELSTYEILALIEKKWYNRQQLNKLMYDIREIRWSDELSY